MNKQLRMALELAYEKHKDQVDKAGKPYFLHPIRVSHSSFVEDKAKIVAILHDIIEDTDVTEEYLLDLGFDKDIVDAIVLLTRGKDEEYFSYVRKIRNSGNSYAFWVKVSDLYDNMDLTRIDNPTDSDVKRVEKYQKALDILIKE